jgi:hypothetical protein
MNLSYCSALCIVLTMVASPAAGGDAMTKTYVGTRCVFSFDYPATWTAIENPVAAIPDPHDMGFAKCAVGLRPPGWSTEMRRSPYVLQPTPVRVVFWNKGFVQSARDSYFVRVGDWEPDERPAGIQELQPWDWGIVVRGGVVAAQQFRTRCCQGVRGTSWGHGQAKDGSKTTIGWEGAVINDRSGHSLVIESDSSERFKLVVTRIIESSRLSGNIDRMARNILRRIDVDHVDRGAAVEVGPAADVGARGRGVLSPRHKPV